MDRDRRGALASPQAEHEFVLTEGAGSPAEINLRDTDLANMRTAQAAGARVLVVADIEAFASLYRTWALLPEDEPAVVKQPRRRALSQSAGTCACRK